MRLLSAQSIDMGHPNGIMPDEAAISSYLIIGNDAANIWQPSHCMLRQAKGKQKEYTLHVQNVQQLLPKQEKVA